MDRQKAVIKLWPRLVKLKGLWPPVGQKAEQLLCVSASATLFFCYFLIFKLQFLRNSSFQASSSIKLFFLI